MIYNLGTKKPNFNPAKVWIAESADLIGDVILEPDVSVWFNVTIRGDNETIIIKEGTNIQDNTVIHTDEGIVVEIGKNVTVGHKVIIHGAQIANSLVTENKSFPDNSLIMGSPAKVVRELSDDEVKLLAYSSKHYIEKSKHFAKELKVET